MNSKATAIIADDHPLMANATKALLEDSGYVEVVQVVGTGKQCLDAVDAHRPRLLILDHHLPDIWGNEVAEQVVNKYPDIRIVIFTGCDLTDLAELRIMDLGVSAVISKGTAESTMKHMIPCILDDHVVFPRTFLDYMKDPQRKPLINSVLTREEINIMQMVIQGATHESIGEKIHTSRRTVDNHLRRMYQKLGVKGKIQAIEKFLSNEHYLPAKGDEHED